jgi:AraC-like DNA-binding protein
LIKGLKILPILLAPAIRKFLIEALSNKILPALQASEAVPMLLADMPLRLPKNIEVEHLDVPLLPDIHLTENSSTTTAKSWPNERMNSVNCPYIAFIFEGAADLRLGTTVGMAANASAEYADSDWVRYGQHILRVKSPAVLLFLPGIPLSDGSRPHWESSRHEPAHSQILWLHIMADHVLCHACISEAEVHTAHNPLRIDDVIIYHLICALQDELKGYSLHHDHIVQSLLQALLLRLHRQLVLHDPIVAITAWKDSPYSLRSDGSSPITPVIEEAVAFIHSRLHERISIDQVAAHCQLSSRQLNRHFRSTFDMTVKEYINYQKMIAAQQMLLHSDMSTTEIGILLGFSQTSHFCNLFRRHTKLSPGRFRKRP